MSREDHRNPWHRETTWEKFRDPRHHPYRDPKFLYSPRSSSKKENMGGSAHTYKPTIKRNDYSDCVLSHTCSRFHSPKESLYHDHRIQFQPLYEYERPTMYDWTPKCLQEDQEYRRKNAKTDRDIRRAGFLDNSNSYIGLRQPFQAKEIDGSMFSLTPKPYKVYEHDVPVPKYSELRQRFQSKDTADPRLRRILGLPELSNSKALAALGRPSHSKIASPSNVESSSSPKRFGRERLTAPTRASTRGVSVDPRHSAGATGPPAPTFSFQAHFPQLPAGNPRQNIEIGLLLQKSDWYKNLNSNAKIIVNQELALVLFELNKYHQDPSPNKIFDKQFIVNNQNLQKILHCLGIYFDDYGQVAHVGNMMMGGGVNPMMMMNDPNMFPPNMKNMMEAMGHGGAMAPGGHEICGRPGNIPQYARNPRMRMSPGNVLCSGGEVSFNPVAGNPCDYYGEGGHNNPFSNNFVPNGGHFNNQQLNSDNRNHNRQGGVMMNNENIQNQNRSNLNQNHREGGGGFSCGGVVNIRKYSYANGVDAHDRGPVMGVIDTGTNQNTKVDDDVEESWDD